MATDGFEGFYVGPGTTAPPAAFWKSLGFEKLFETDHGSGQWTHPAGGPYVFIDETHEGELDDTPDLDRGGLNGLRP